MHKHHTPLEKKSLYIFLLGLIFVCTAIGSIPFSKIFLNTDVTETVFYTILITGLLLHISGFIIGSISLKNTTSKKMSIMGILLNALIPLGIVGFYGLMYLILILIY